MNLNEPVSGQYDEWLGTATADDWSANSDMYEVLGVDSQTWDIVGFEVSPLDRYLTVYATRDRDMPVEYSDDAEQRHSEWLGAIKTKGHLPVHRITIENPDVLDRVFKRFSVRLFTNVLVKHDLAVEVIGDVVIGEPDEI